MKLSISGVILGYRVLGVLLAFFALAVGATGLGYINLEDSIVSNG